MRSGKKLLNLWQKRELSLPLLERWKEIHGYNPVKSEQRRERYFSRSLVGLILAGNILLAIVILGWSPLTYLLPASLAFGSAFCFLKAVSLETGDDCYEHLTEVSHTLDLGLGQIASLPLEQLQGAAEQKVSKQIALVQKIRQRVGIAGNKTFMRELSRQVKCDHHLCQRQQALRHFGLLKKGCDEKGIGVT